MPPRELIPATTTPLPPADRAVHGRVARLRLESKRADLSSGDHRRVLRVLHRYVAGIHTAQQAAAELGGGWDAERVERDALDWPLDIPSLASCWLVQPSHPAVAAARAAAEKSADRRDFLRKCLVLRLQQAGGAVTAQQAADAAGLPLPGWQLFCAVEDAASPDDDRVYREGWVVNGDKVFDATTAGGES